MKTYAYIGDGNFVIQRTSSWVNEVGVEIPIEELYPAYMVENMIEITDLDPMPDQYWTWDGSTFSPPKPYQPSPEEILSQNQNRQTSLKTAASIAMTPYMLSLNLGEATDAETVLAKAWQAYYRALNTVDMTIADPEWPVAPV